jgi:hypothetical protein
LQLFTRVKSKDDTTPLDFGRVVKVDFNRRFLETNRRIVNFKNIKQPKVMKPTKQTIIWAVRQLEF